MRSGSRLDVFRIFLRLGVTSSGGVVAHIACFHRGFVSLRAWLSETQFADLLALCPFLPGSASSQMGIAIRLSRGGISGSIAAWLGLTLPSELSMLLLARALHRRDAFISAGALPGSPLLAAVYPPIGVSARQKPADWPLSAIAPLALTVGRFAAWAVVAAGAVAGLVFA